MNIEIPVLTLLERIARSPALDAPSARGLSLRVFEGDDPDLLMNAIEDIELSRASYVDALEGLEVAPKRFSNEKADLNERWATIALLIAGKHPKQCGAPSAVDAELNEAVEAEEEDEVDVKIDAVFKREFGHG